MRTLALAVLAGVTLQSSQSVASDLSDTLNLRLRYLSQNQSVISQNLANANTPGYKSMELISPDYSSATGNNGKLIVTSPMHIGGIGKQTGFKLTKQKNAYETAPNGNNVSVEEQMLKMSQNSTKYQATASLIKKIEGFTKIALGER